MLSKATACPYSSKTLFRVTLYPRRCLKPVQSRAVTLSILEIDPEALQSNMILLS